VAETVFADAVVCLGGSGQATGKAVIQDGGYRASGSWRYATGAPHVTHFTAHCILEKDGKDLLDHEGNPVVRSVFFPSGDVPIVRDWCAFARTASVSPSFGVNHRWADASQAFFIVPPRAM